MALIVFCISSYAYDFKVDGIAYSIIGDNEVEVSPSDEQITDESIKIPSDIDHDGFNYRVVRIGDSAFRNSKVKYVTLPNTITEIGNQAFAGCDKLKTFSIKDGLTKIGDRAFEGSSFVSWIVPSTVTEVGERAFSNLECLYIYFKGETPVTFGDYTFAGSSIKRVYLPENLAVIPEGCFKDCDSLEELMIGNGIQAIGRSVFDGCHSLISLAIPNSSVDIDEDAFAGSVLKAVGFNFFEKPEFSPEPFCRINTISVVTMPLDSADIIKSWAGDFLENKASLIIDKSSCSDFLFQLTLIYPGIFEHWKASNYIYSGLITLENTDILLMADRGSDISIMEPALFGADIMEETTFNGQIIKLDYISCGSRSDFIDFRSPIDDYYSEAWLYELENLDSDSILEKRCYSSVVKTVQSESNISFDSNTKTILAPNETIRVYDAAGRLMAHGRDSLSVAALHAGIYIVNTPARSIKINISK